MTIFYYYHLHQIACIYMRYYIKSSEGVMCCLYQKYHILFLKSIACVYVDLLISKGQCSTSVNEYTHVCFTLFCNSESCVCIMLNTKY